MALRFSYRSLRLVALPWGAVVAFAYWIGRDTWTSNNLALAAVAIAAVLGSCVARRGPWPEVAVTSIIACLALTERSSPATTSTVFWALGVASTLFAYHISRFARRIRSSPAGSGLDAYTRRSMAKVFLVGLFVWIVVAMVGKLPQTAGSFISERWADSIDAASPTVLAIVATVVVLIAAATTALRTSISFSGEPQATPQPLSRIDTDQQQVSTI